MEIQLISSDQLKISLTEMDLEKLGVTYDSLDYSDPQTKKAILSLLMQAKKTTGFDPHHAKLYVEVYPEDEGGCTLFFTSVQKKPASHRSTDACPCGPVIFEFSNLDILVDASCKLFCQYGHRIYKSFLYRLDESYRLIIYPLDSVDNVTVGFLCEYGRMVGEGELLAAFVAEHGQCIIRDNAIDTLTKYMG